MFKGTKPVTYSIRDSSKASVKTFADQAKISGSNFVDLLIEVFGPSLATDLKDRNDERDKARRSLAAVK